MSELVAREFPAKALITGLRSIGYSFSAAVADIIDNSISAEADTVSVYSDPLADIPYFAILDNGHGMNADELNNAMLPGSDRTNVQDSELELGRFGLGLKSASLSQCREFIVVTKKNNQMHAMAFDLDIIEAENRLMLKILDYAEISILPHIEKLEKYDNGTLVIWRSFDKMEALAKKFETTFRSAVDDAENHVSLVFHRFYDSVTIFFNERRIGRRDPFLKNAAGRQQTGRKLPITIEGSTIMVTPYSLPYANTITKDEMELLGNPKSIYDEQGFYIYRNKRLITWGSWLRMNVRSEFFKLARVQVDIPSTLDSVWMLDVKKSSAKIPDLVKDKIKIALNDSLIRSKRAVRNPGVKEASAHNTVWERINLRDGEVCYKISKELPQIVDLYASLNENQKKMMDDIIFVIEQSIPKYRIQNDISASVTITNDVFSLEEEKLMDMLTLYLNQVPEIYKKEKLDKLLHTEVFEILLSKKQLVVKRFCHE